MLTYIAGCRLLVSWAAPFLNGFHVFKNVTDIKTCNISVCVFASVCLSQLISCVKMPHTLISCEQINHSLSMSVLQVLPE